MLSTNDSFTKTFPRDLISGLVVFLVALPLCLGVALASNAPLFSGVLAGIVGGIVVGAISGSHSSVSGPAAGLTAVVAAQIATLGSFEDFLLAVMIAGVIQLVIGLLRGGVIAAFFPNSVIKGLLAAIGVILILKQIPHVFGHDPDPQGDLAFLQPDEKNTFTELIAVVYDIQYGAAVIGLVSIGILLFWDRYKPLKKSLFPAPLAVVLFGVVVNWLYQYLGNSWPIEPSHLVQVPVTDNPRMFLSLLRLPDFTEFLNLKIYLAAVTIAAVASLETLLNLEAVDKIDPLRRNSPPSRELVAQGVGNICCGLIGGLPVTSVIIRSSVNIHSGGRTKLATIFHGLLLLFCVMLLPAYLNLIPLSALAAILLVTGIKLASPQLIRTMWRGGWSQFLPFSVTVIAIVLTDLLVGVLIGLVVSIGFILYSNVRRPIRRIVEKHLGGEVVHIELANQVSFLNKAALMQVLDEVPPGGHVLLDARGTNYIDPDVLGLLREFHEQTGPARNITVSLKGFREHYQLQDQTQYVDYSTQEIQSTLTPEQVLQILKEGHERTRRGLRLTRDFDRQVHEMARGQHPLAIVLSCIDSRTPAELVFDLGMGDIFSVRVAGNIISRKILGSIEYGTAVAGAKLILVMGHTRCGAVTAAVNLASSQQSPAQATGCQHIHHIVQDIQQSITDRAAVQHLDRLSAEEREQLVNCIAKRNVTLTMENMLKTSDTLQKLVDEGKIALVGVMYDVNTGNLEFLSNIGIDPMRTSRPLVNAGIQEGSSHE